MIAMDDDDDDQTIATLIQAARGFRDGNRYPADQRVEVILPDWLYARGTDHDRDELLTREHIIVRSHSEVYGSATS